MKSILTILMLVSGMLTIAQTNPTFPHYTWNTNGIALPSGFISFGDGIYPSIVSQAGGSRADGPQLIERRWGNWDPLSDSWEDYRRYTYSYNTLEQQDTIWKENPAGGFAQWDMSSRTVNTYTSELLTEASSQPWDDMVVEFAPANRRTLYTYDGDDNLATESDESRLNEFQSWNVTHITKYFYTDGKLTTREQCGGSSGLYYRAIYSYNSGGLVEEINSFDIDDLGNATHETRVVFDYDVNGNMTELFLYIPDGFGGWVNVQRNQYDYNTDNQLTETLIEWWVDNQWQPQYKMESSHSPDDSYSEFRWLEYDGTSWFNTERHVYVYAG